MYLLGAVFYCAIHFRAHLSILYGRTSLSIWSWPVRYAYRGPQVIGTAKLFCTVFVRSYTAFVHELRVLGPEKLDSRIIEATGRSQVTGRGIDMNETLHLSSLSKTAVLSIECKTTNVGGYDGAEAVMIFAAPPGAGEAGRPLKSLVDFDRVFLTSSRSVVTRFNVTAQHLTVATALNEATVRREAVKGSWRFWAGPSGQNDSVVVDVV